MSGTKTRILCVTNQKGGVGKTTTALNLAASLASMKHKVLLIDLDAQGNASSASGIQEPNGIAQVLLGETAISNVIYTTSFQYDVIPADYGLTRSEMALLHQEQREYQLKNMLTPLQLDYDYILIDCPPSLNILTVNALVASHAVLIPVQCEYFALEGLAQLLTTINTLKNACHPTLAIEGILRTMYDGRNRLAQEVSEQLHTHFQQLVFNTVIPRNIRLAESPSHSKPVLYHDKRSQGSMAYLALAGELTRKHQQMEAA